MPEYKPSLLKDEININKIYSVRYFEYDTNLNLSVSRIRFGKWFILTRGRRKSPRIPILLPFRRGRFISINRTNGTI